MENVATRAKRFIGKTLQCYPRWSDCIIDVLAAIMADRRNVVCIDRDAYEHVGIRYEDPRVIPSKERRLRMANYATAADCLNVDFLCVEFIRVLPSANSRRLPVEMKRLRTFVVIHAGVLHLRMFEAKLTEDTFDRLRIAGVLDEDAETYDPKRIYRISLPGRRNLPIVSRAWANPFIMRLDDLLREEINLCAEQKELHHHLEVVVHSTSLPMTSSGNRYPRFYRGKGTPIGPIEAYESPCALIRIKKYKPPSVVGKYDTLPLGETVERIHAVHRALRIVRFRLRAITFAIVEYGHPVFNSDPGKKVPYKKTERLIRKGEIAGAKLELVTWTGTFERTAA